MNCWIQPLTRRVSLAVTGIGLTLLAASQAMAQSAAVLMITEIHYHPHGGGQDLEFIELYNNTPAPLDLSGYFFSRGINFAFPPGTYLDGNKYLVVCANQEKIKEVYGIANVIGDWAQCSGENDGCALDNGGEAIEISEENGVVATSVRYNDRGTWPAGADGTGYSLEIRDTYDEQDDPENWRISAAPGGSPGLANPEPPASPPLWINEGLLRTDGERWIELYNAGSEAADVSGFLVSNDPADLYKAQIPAGKSVPAGGWLALTAAELALDLAPVAAGPAAPPRLWFALSPADRSRIIDAYAFEPRADGFSEARFPDGDETFIELADPTRGAANKHTVERDVVINEFLYHAYDNDLRREFIELYNRSDRSIDISGWSFTQGFNFTFPESTVLTPKGYLVVARDPAFIRETYGLDEKQVLGPDPENPKALDAFGQLRDDGERITLRDPRGVIADTVRYHDGGEWPHWADGSGSSCELIDAFQDNNIGAAWDASDDSAEAPVGEFSYTGTFYTNEPEMHVLLMGRGITVMDDLEMLQRQTVLEVKGTIVDLGAGWRYFKGRQEPSEPREAWRQPDFDDAAWEAGSTPIGFGEADVQQGTEILDMRDGYLSLYLRREFTVADPVQVENIVLSTIYDDGFIAYLNGERVITANMRETNGVLQDQFDVAAQSSRDRVVADFDLAEFKHLLKPGRNVLAIQVHNSSVGNADLLMVPKLVDGVFVTRDSANLIPNGDFEAPIVANRITPGAWLLEGTHWKSGRTEKDAISGSGSFKVIASGKGDNKVNRLEQTLAGLRARDRYTISFKARWLIGSPTLLTHGHNQAGANFDYPASHRLKVPETLGTPGAVNSVSQRQIDRGGAANIGPVIDKVSQDLAVPAANVPVTVRARIQDSDGVAGATLRYWIEDSAGRPGPSQAQEIPMQGPDARGYYHATIDGRVARTRVIYFIEARDGGGRLGRFPVDVLDRTHPLVLDPESPAVGDSRYLLYRHDTALAARYPTYRLWMTQADEQLMSSRKLLSNDVLPATFIFNNREMYHGAGVRFSGSPWARGAWSSFRLSAPKDKPLHGAIKKFNTEVHQGAGAVDGREPISHYLIRMNQGDVRAPYSFQWLVQIQVNDRASGVRDHVQTPNTELLQRWFPGEDEGDFFEMDDRFEINDGGTRQNSIDGYLRYPPYTGTGTGDDKEQYRFCFSLRQNEQLDDFSQLIDLARHLSPGSIPDAQYDEAIWDIIDVEAFLRVWAIRLNTDDWDTWGTRRGKNCYLFRQQVNGHWVLLPWDMELTYADVNAFMPPAITQNYTNGIIFPEVTRFINRPRIKRLYYGILKEMIDRHFWSTFLEPYMTKLGAEGLQSVNVGRRGGYVDQKRNLLNGILRSATLPSVGFEITTNGGNPLTVNAASTRLAGRAPVEVRSIVAVVNGEEPKPPIDVAFSNANVFVWEADVPLVEGLNAVEFYAFSGSGDLVATDAIDITASLTPPAIAGIEPARAEAGQRVAISGSGLVTGVKVFFGDREATEVVVKKPSSLIEAVVPVDVPLGALDVVVKIGELASNAFSIEIVPPRSIFIRGDIDLSGSVNVGDVVGILHYLFGGRAIPCNDAADVDDTGGVNVTDAVVLLDYLYRRGSPPAAPFPQPGRDTSADALICETGIALP
jgi:hypothetical protein